MNVANAQAFLTAAALLCVGLSTSRAESPAATLFRTVDLDVGETVDVTLSDGVNATVKLLDLRESRDTVSNAVRSAEVDVEVNGHRATLVSANYRLPQLVGGVQIDCPVTGGYNDDSKQDAWGLERAARMRLWPADSPWMPVGAIVCPVKQRWFASATQMANEPTFVDGGESPKRKGAIYYHSGLDIGGAEGMADVVAATDGLVVSAGERSLDEHLGDTPVVPRYDVVYVLDERGWYHRYSHLKSIDGRIQPGRIVKQGETIGVLGKEGTSGGWSHLHFEIKSRQPSGKWGTQAGYAFLWEANLREFQPQVIAVARPHLIAWTGDEVQLDASRTWTASGAIERLEWTLSDGGSAVGPTVERSYDQPGQYSEIVKAVDAHGNVDYDFATVVVLDRKTGRPTSTIHAAYAPTIGVRPGDELTFKVRSFGAADANERWDFGDGSMPVVVRSDGAVDRNAPDGYAITTHRFAQPGEYIVRVERTDESGAVATAHLHVHVGQ